VLFWSFKKYLLFYNFNSARERELLR